MTALAELERALAQLGETLTRDSQTPMMAGVLPLDDPSLAQKLRLIRYQAAISRAASALERGDSKTALSWLHWGEGALDSARPRDGEAA